MSRSPAPDPNAQAALELRARSGALRPVGPVVMLLARFLLALASFFVIALGFNLFGVADAWHVAAGWWVVYGTLIDLGCLVLLAYFTRREEMRLFDLWSWGRTRPVRDFLLGLGLFVLFLVIGIGGGALITTVIYGAPQGAPRLIAPLPPLAAAYSLLVWTLIWGITEEMTYQGYVLPRLQVLTGRTWLAVLLVMLSFGLQHTALPFMLDGRFMLWRFLPSMLVGLVDALLYLRLRRLFPLIVAHWLVNVVTVASVVFVSA